MTEQEKRSKATTAADTQPANDPEVLEELFGEEVMETVGDAMEELPLDGVSEEEELAAVTHRLHEAERKLEEQKNSYLRLMAEMENLRKRTSREIDQSRKYAVENFARDLLPVADNMERALSAIDAKGGEESDPTLRTMSEGVRMIQGALTSSLSRHGVTRIAAVNAVFDPNLHQAVMQVASAAEPGTVVLELQAGYLLNDRLLRPAMVGVAKPVED